MSIKSSILAITVSTVILAACNSETNQNDPIREEVITACEQLKAYQSMEATKRTSLCECTYDEALRGLSEDEKNAVRFYLLEQVGVDTSSKNLIKQSPDMKVMLNASEAIGNSVKQCR